MAPINWQSVRIGILATTCGGIMWVLFQALVVTRAGEESSPPVFIFPDQVPISKWEQRETKSLTKPLTKKEEEAGTEEIINGQQYQYVRKQRTLTIETRYENYTDGNVSRLLAVYTPIKPATVNLNLRNKEGIGDYTIFAHDDKLYLSACMNPKGGSTVTEQKFIRNRYTHDLNAKRILFWALGQNDLLDISCLWTLLSLPTDAQTQSQSFLLAQNIQFLETAWFDWFNWWRNRLTDN